MLEVNGRAAELVEEKELTNDLDSPRFQVWMGTPLKVSDEGVALLSSLVIFSGYAQPPQQRSREGKCELNSGSGFCQFAIMGWWEDSGSW